MNRADLPAYLRELRDVISRERNAASALQVDEMMALTARKEALLQELLSVVDSLGELTEQEQQMADSVYSENLRNAYFFWSALKWVRQSVCFINDQISPASYKGNGCVARARSSGSLLSGRV